MHSGTSPPTWRNRCLPSSISMHHLCLRYACTACRCPTWTAHSHPDVWFTQWLQLRCLGICGTWRIHLHMFWHEWYVLSCVDAAFEVSKSFLVNFFFSVHGQWYSHFPSSQLFLQYVRWSDKLIIVCELQESVCDRLGWTFDMNLFRWHSYRSYSFFQWVLYFLFCCVVVRSWNYSSSLVLIFLCLVAFIPRRSLSSRFLCCLDPPTWSSFFNGADFFVHSVVFFFAIFLHFSIVVLIPCRWTPTDCSTVPFVCFITCPHFQSYALEISAVHFPFFPSDLLEALYFSHVMGSVSSLSCISPISRCFLLWFLSSADPTEVIISSSFIPPCSPRVIPRAVSFIMLLSSIVSTQCFCLDSQRAEGLSKLCPSALSLVTLDADCLSADRSHVHGHVEELLVHLVHTFAGDREEVILQLVAFGLMSVSFGSRFLMFWFTLSLPLSHLLHH